MLIALVLLSLSGLALLPFIIFYAVRHSYRVARQANLEMVQDFDDTLKKYLIDSYEVVTEIVRPAVDSPPSGHVRRIFFDNKGQYYLYLYYSGHPGILKPLSKERALLAAGTTGQVKV